MRIRKVAIYARVSTEHEAQLSALENQVQYYDNLLNTHPDWILYKYYIDEGITGTSIKKRKHFLEMMEDAKKGRFDLIVTREVSRFARNTVDTLQQTRLLKRMGVEVYFTEDGIWTLNDEDGELRLTIMATLAQNESKKTSTRVKAGQMVSFQNGVIYGNGNVMGYDKIGKEYVIDEVQAKVVRKIYNMYLAGEGYQKIKKQLEYDHDLTAMGKSIWSFSAISSILKNRLYCGQLEYRKEYVPDYLEQKRAPNNGEVEKVIVEGRHQPIISKEEFERVQKIMEQKSPMIKRYHKNKGVYSNDLWRRKLRCKCGHSFLKTKWHVKKEITTYAYKCYSQNATGTVSARKKRGLSIEGICPIPMVQDWKLFTMAQSVFHAVFDCKEDTIQTAEEKLGNGIVDTEKVDILKDKVDTEERLKRERDRYNVLLEMRMNNEIPKEVFYAKREEVESKIAELERLLIQYGDIKEATAEDVADKLKNLTQVLEQGLELENGEFPENAINKYVYGVKVYEEHFEWILNLQVGAEEEADHVDTPVYFKTITVTPDDQRRWFKAHPAWSKSNKYEDLKVKIYI
ncbi:DNA invertase Pin-like site-specific DNA recombinase [Lachnotalea glycerini]|uniref:DNA invertase Pin-like site-specific DNA recombinase n=1 Tax=Lachnotalea glycerini TaxID=1763509 RepID=A0A318EQR9_9FIRM|nr:recombinase family protein [Lachnotalea glycerini]PXV93797.1 DNA invertase Pin-like site-specific DNA recombinase [Lachnotalea glycerini]